MHGQKLSNQQAFNRRTYLPMMLTLLPVQLHLADTIPPKLSMMSETHLGLPHSFASLQPIRCDYLSRARMSLILIKVTKHYKNCNCECSLSEMDWLHNSDQWCVV